LFELAVSQAVRKALAADPDTFQYTVALQLMHNQLGVNQALTEIKIAVLQSCFSKRIRSHITVK